LSDGRLVLSGTLLIVTSAGTGHLAVLVAEGNITLDDRAPWDNIPIVAQVVDAILGPTCPGHVRWLQAVVAAVSAGIVRPPWVALGWAGPAGHFDPRQLGEDLLLEPDERRNKVGGGPAEGL